jgi:hypothetical protein
MTYRLRLELLQWYALLGGALAWAAQHVLGYFISVAGCSTSVGHWHVNMGLWQTLVGVAALAGVLLAELAAFRVYQATKEIDEDAPGPDGRLHFFAEAALLGNVLFLMLVLLDGAGSLYHLNCQLA